MRAASKTCPTCKQRITPRPVIEDKSRNGVRVHVFRYASGGTVVDASCQCFGHAFRLHSNEACPLRLRLIRQEASS